MNRLILFSHFHEADRVEPHILAHLRALRELGGSLHFISNGTLAQEEGAKLDGLVDRILLRENTGMDFSMWQAALAEMDLCAIDELVLTNSSLLGPCVPLAPLFQRMAAQPCDFWGLTESWEGCYHLQSYFLVFRKAALEAPAFRQFWASVLPYRSKLNIVWSYELGLSQFLREQGLRSAVAFPLLRADNRFLWNLLLRRRWSMRVRRFGNPVLDYPDLLLRSGMPYVKRARVLGPATGLGERWVRGLCREVGLDLPA